MSQSVSLSENFEEASLSFRDLLDNFQENLHDLPRLMQKWPEALQSYRTSLRQLPRVMRRRPFVKNLLREINSFEKELHRGGFTFEGLQAHARRARVLIAEMENSPTFQKFLRGESVLSSKKALHWSRKIVHMSLGLIFLYFAVYSGIPRPWVLGVLLTFVGSSIALETARHLIPRVNRWVQRYFGPIMREREKAKINSAIFYMVSMAVVYFTTPIEVAVLTLLFLAVGDPFAGIIGVVYGKHRISAHATLEGSSACFVACAGLAALSAGVLFPHGLSGLPLIAFSLLGGLIGAVAESSFIKLDDNLIMPLISAPSLWLLMWLFGIL